jgi:hypothetical protein
MATDQQTVYELSQVPALPRAPRLNVLLLADDRHPANVVQDHVRAIAEMSRHRIVVTNPIHRREARWLKLEPFDAVLIHYSICVLFDYFLPERYVWMLRDYRGLKAQMIQDEYRWVDRMTTRMGELGIEALLSSLTPENIERVYHQPQLACTFKCSTLPGYIPPALVRQRVAPIADRARHVVYRGRDLPYWFGRAGQDKKRIAEQFLGIAARYGLQVDIAAGETDRIYGEDWVRFLCSGKAVLATEGGASIFDFDGTVEARVKAYLEVQPGADFDEVAEAVLRKDEGNIVHRTITPRSFEAIALRTALVMYPGAYRGILQPWRHYIPLDPSGNNADEVVRCLRDDAFLQQLVDRAYAEIVKPVGYHMRDFVAGVDRVLDQAYARHCAAQCSAGRDARPPTGLAGLASGCAGLAFDRFADWAKRRRHEVANGGRSLRLTLQSAARMAHRLRLMLRG